jgi:hypothetical protein
MIGFHSHILLQATWLRRNTKPLRHLAAIDLGESIGLSRSLLNAEIFLPLNPKGARA